MHARLRAGTRAAHERLDACFPNGLQDMETYRCYLRGMHAFASALDEALMEVDAGALLRYDEQVHWLASDLRVLGAEFAQRVPRMELADANEAIGACYVMEGSALGARLLLRQVQAIPVPAETTRFLRQHAAVPSRWGDFLQRLDRLPASAADGVFRGALHGFALAQDCFAAAVLHCVPAIAVHSV